MKVAAPSQSSLPYEKGSEPDVEVTLDSQGMPDDLVLPISQYNGVLLPATAVIPKEVDGYDPWTYAIPAKIKDWSIPASDSYGGVSAVGKAGSIVAEWGGMPAPVRDYQDQDAMVALLPRQMQNIQGPTGTFYGPQQTAWEASYVTPATDYWSTVILQH